MKIFRLKFCIFGRKFLEKNKFFFDSQKFGVGNYLPYRPLDDATVTWAKLYFI